jgi:glycosyltransferase 2 family protein
MTEPGGLPAPVPGVQPTSGNRKNLVLRILGSLLAAGLIVFWLVQNWTDVAQTFLKVGWEGFLFSLILTLTSRFSTVGRWHSLLRSADIPIRPRQSIQLTFAGLFSANFLPTTVGGDLVRFAGGVKLGFEPAVVAASLVADRLVGMAGMATVLPLGLYQMARTPLPAPTSRTLWPAAGIALPPALRKPAAWAWARTGQLWASLMKALRLWLARPRALLLSYLFTWGHMLSVFLSVWILFQRIGESIPLWLVGGCWALSYFPTLLPVSINGLGVQELTLTFFFVNVGGVSLPAALAMATLMRVLQALASLPGAFFVPGLLTAEKKETI